MGDEMPSKKSEKGPEVPAAAEAAMVPLFDQLRDVMSRVDAKQLEQAKRKVSELKNVLSEEDLKILDLEKFTPEKMTHMAEVGYNEFKLGRYVKSERIFRGLTVIDSENYYYHQMLGAAFQRQEKLAEAIVEYGIALMTNPSDTVSLTNRGECYFKAGIHELALKDFDAAMDLDPEERGEDKWINRARILKRQIGLIRR